MIQEIENRRSIRKYKEDKISKKLLEEIDFIGTDCQLTGIVAVGVANEAPAKRPRKPFADIVEFR